MATGIDYFIMTTVYNGYKTSFMIYNRDYENITPDSPEGMTEVWSVTMANNQVINKNIYWEKTDEKNSVTIEAEVKKHNRDAYINAVKDQFQYFNGKVNLGIENSNGYTSWERLDDSPEFESDNLLIPKYSTYSSPHILVDGISYGLVSWDELELEDRVGKIALKVSANQVDITQSRESLKWTDKTKTTILHAIHIAEDEASEFVRSNIVIEDVSNVFALNDAYNIMSGMASHSVINTFSKFLQMHNIRPKYTITLPPLEEGKKERKIEATLDFDLFDFLFYSFDFKKVYTYVDGKKLKIKTELIKSFSELGGKTLIFSKETNLGPKLANHLLEKFNVSSFVYVRENNTRIKDWIALNKQSQDYKTSEIKAYAENLIIKYNDLFLDTYEVTYDETVEEENIQDAVLENTAENAAKVRRLNKEIMWYEYFHESYGYDEIYFSRVKEVCKVANLEDYTKQTEIIIVPSAYTKLGKMLVILEKLRPNKNKTRIVFVAEENIKHFALLGGIHIENYFRTLNTETGELMIGKKLVELNTAWQFKKLKEKYSQFSDESALISELSTISKSKYESFNLNNAKDIKEVMVMTTGKDSAIVEEILTYLDTLAAFQDVVESKDKDLISAKALELFGTDKIYNIYGYDKDYIDSVEEELKRLSPIGPLIANLNSNYTDECVPLLNLLLTTIHKNN